MSLPMFHTSIVLPITFSRPLCMSNGRIGGHTMMLTWTWHQYVIPQDPVQLNWGLICVRTGQRGTHGVFFQFRVPPMEALSAF
jgi:hypothetical protein